MRLRRVGIVGPAPRVPAAYDAWFGAPVAFEAHVDELVFDRALLDSPLRTADRATAAALGTHGRGICPELQAPDPFLDAVRDAARRGLERGDARVATTASRLGLSVRTLQRRLGELGASYSALVDDVRRETALQLVGRRPSTEVALMLGFSTPAAFFRAFRRWTGTTPRTHVAALRG
jgi:AraC-like DNA-binding protein